MSPKSDVDRLRELAMEQLEDGPERKALLAEPVGDISDLPEDLLKAEEETEEVTDEKALKVGDLTVPQKMKLAMLGNKTARTLMLREPNRMIQLFVLNNARITDGELVDIAKNTQVDEQVLRVLAEDSQWMKNYPMKLAVCYNPKVPVDLTLKWFKFLTPRDLQSLARSKNVPQILATQARKLLDKRAKKGGGSE